MDDGNSDKKAKETKKCVIKGIFKFNDYKDCLLNNEIILKSQQRFKSEAHNVYTEKINKIALNSNGDKRLQNFVIAKLNPIVTELFIRGRKLNISVVFMTQSYFKVPKDITLNSTHFFIMKIPNKRELQKIALNHSLDIDFKDF